MNFLSILSDPNTQWILAGSMLLGLASGVIGSFAYLRKQSLMGDALSHAALPGVCLAYMVTGTKSIFFFLIGAVIAGTLVLSAWHHPKFVEFCSMVEQSFKKESRQRMGSLSAFLFKIHGYFLRRFGVDCF